MSRTDHSLTHPTLKGLLAAASDPSRALLNATMEAAQDADLELWAVGGCIRDLCAGLEVRDLDVALAGDAGQLAGETAARIGATASVEARFGTARVEAAGQRIDLASLRTETYGRPGALPTVRTGATIEQDLARRDFSVNAVALALTGSRAGEIVDPCGGLRDLELRRLRVLHERSFIDDATRLWRGARYAARLGLHPTLETAQLIAEGGRWLVPISGRRLWAEFERSAEERRVLATFRLLEGWGVLRATCAGFEVSDAAAAALRHRPGPIPSALLLAVLLAPLEPGVRHSVAARLQAPREVVRAVEDAVMLLRAPEPTPEAVEAATRTGEAGRVAARWVDPDKQTALQRALRRWERTRPHLDASELVGLGVPRGPALGGMLRRLRRARYLGTLTGAAEARAAVRAWLAEEQADHA